MRTIPRSHLAAEPDFDLLSPQPGEIDADAAASLAATDPDRALALLAAMAAATDRSLAALAARIAGRLVLDLARTGPSAGNGIGRLEAARADRSSGDLDLDRSLTELIDARAAGRAPHLSELWVRRWQRPATAITLVVDRSGSMTGPRLASAAVATAACALRAPQQWAALAFAERAVAIKSVDNDRSANEVVEDVLRLRGYGTTDLAAALNASRSQLARCTARRRVTILLSDCRATTGGDPLAAARRIEELCVIAPADDATDAAEFAAAAGARFAVISSAHDTPAAIRAVLA